MLWMNNDKLAITFAGGVNEVGHNCLICENDNSAVIIDCGIKPLPGAKNFLDQLRSQSQVIILTDSYYEFVMPIAKSLGLPTILCNWLSVDPKGFISDYHLRQPNGKEKAVRALKSIGFKVKAAGIPLFFTCRDIKHNIP